VTSKESILETDSKTWGLNVDIGVEMCLVNTVLGKETWNTYRAEKTSIGISYRALLVSYDTKEELTQGSWEDSQEDALDSLLRQAKEQVGDITEKPRDKLLKRRM